MRTVLTRGALLALLVLALASCAVSLIAPYDEQTDARLTELARSVDDFFDRAGRMTYAEARPTYAGLLGDLRVVRLRATARPKNDITVSMLDQIRISLARVETQHERADRLSPAFVEEVRDLIAREIGDTIALEIAKRRLR